MSNPPPIQPNRLGPPPSPQGMLLDYAVPTPGPSRNKWWMVMLRIVGGLIAGLGSGALGFLLVGLTNVQWLWIIPPGLMLAIFMVVAIKFRRFGYVTGFVLAPFVAVVGFILLLIIIFSAMAKPHP